MSFWNILIPVLTLIVGLALGFLGGVFYLRSQMTKMQNNPDMLAKMAKQMGYNMNKQQLQKAQQMMKNQNQNAKPRR
ncbi:YneF family protein [Cohnella ginsengisoli]|uniref:YneF family protein n=1 Tax=Cohnella ginsengisoli TaxID=425004 RepID=A0A9X4KLF3_9BACL|nr:YneF family protein [Cohnella ginsengisoli]MDG0792572.1 YneF family protein [Cohnella ginsengisoli]